MDVDLERTPKGARSAGRGSGTDAKISEKRASLDGTSHSQTMRTDRFTTSQKDVLIKFLSAHMECAVGHPSKIHEPDEQRKVTILWRQLARRLNSVDGPMKTTSEWLEMFHRLKFKLKSKLMSVKPGGKDEMRKKMTPVDVKLLSIFKAAEVRRDSTNRMNKKISQEKQAPATLAPATPAPATPAPATPVPATPAPFHDTEVIVVEDDEIETPLRAEKSSRPGGKESGVQFIQLADGSGNPVGSLKVNMPPNQATVENAKNPLELSPAPTTPRPATVQRRDATTPLRQNMRARIPSPPILLKPTTPLKSLQIEAREAEKRTITSLFQRLVDFYEISNQLKAKEIELLQNERQTMLTERAKVSAAPDEDGAFLNTLLPYMKKLSDARRLKLRSDFQITLMQALQEEHEVSPPNQPGDQ